MNISHYAARLSHVTLSFDEGLQALQDITLDIPQGQRLCILGANGSGKSTLASLLSGLLAPDTGEVELQGFQVVRNGEVAFDQYTRARRHIGVVFQNPGDQIVTTVVEDDVAFGPENLGLTPEEIGKRVSEELERVALTPYRHRDPTRLSGGQQQRVAIAAALALHPSLVVFDEPGALLDVRGRTSIMRVMDELQSRGITVVHITHFMEEALRADRVIVLDAGKVVLDGTPTSVFGKSDRLHSLGLEEPFAAQLSFDLCKHNIDVPWTTDEDTLVTELIARSKQRGIHLSTPAVSTPARQQSLDPLISVRHVDYRYSDATLAQRPALAGINLTFAPGSTTALVGQTGSGKSTLLRLLSALEVPDSGTITIEGLATDHKKERRQLHGRVGYVMQHPERQLFAQTVEKDVAFGPNNMGLTDTEVHKRVAHALTIVGLTGKEQASPFELSGGQQRLCALAGILAMEPPILLLDEPQAGLDPIGRSELTGVLQRVHAEGTTIIEVTHSMDAAAHFEQVIVLNESKILLKGTPQEVFAPEHIDLLQSHGLGLPAAAHFALHLEHALKDTGLVAPEAPAGSILGNPLTHEALLAALQTLIGTEEVHNGIQD